MTTHSGRRGLVKDSVLCDSCDQGDWGRNNFDNTTCKKRSKRKIGEKEIQEYIAIKAFKRATKVAKILKLPSVAGYSNGSNPFGDSNLNEKFVWRKKIERDVSRGVPLEEFSVKAEKKKWREKMAEIDKLKKRREERAIQKAQHEEDMALLARERARSEFSKTEQGAAGSYSPKLLQSGDEEEGARAILERKQQATNPLPQDNFEKNAIKPMGAMEEEADDVFVFGSPDEVNLDDDAHVYKYHTRKPKYFNRLLTHYEWNRYNRNLLINPPPKAVQGYKFNIFYPDLVDKSKPPSYTIHRDGDDSETCILRFHGGPPYEDIAFRIVNQEWDCQRKKGFKCTFESGILRLYFNFKRYPYRR